ncbi:MAG TPA: hypothetical protein VFP58_05195 [Candidatus Eisenbacteria bacterium]|nr:hypothetical protein [Candidatus Eisenbacteria bacterium]
MKRRLVSMLSGLLLLAGSGVTLAHEDHAAAPGAKAAGTAAKAKQTTLTGEIVDTGCYLGQGERGAKHLQCAQLCIRKGMPMGLLTAAGDLYLVVPPHSKTEAYKKVQDWAGLDVEITGTLMARNGMKSIEVASARRPPAKANP